MNLKNLTTQKINTLNESKSFEREIIDLIHDIYLDVRDYFGDGPDDLQVVISAFENVTVVFTDKYRGFGHNGGNVILKIDIPFGYVSEDSEGPDYDKKVDAKYAKPFLDKIVDDIKKYIKAKSAQYKIDSDLAKAEFKF